jgi:glutamyl-tRNA reductase
MPLAISPTDVETAPSIYRIQQGCRIPKEAELTRLFHTLPQLSDRARCEIQQSFDRLVGTLLDPLVESLREESREGVPGVLSDAVETLFQLKEGQLAHG